MLSPAHTAIDEKTSEKESIVPARRATLPLAKDVIPFKIPSDRRIIVDSFAASSPFLRGVLFSFIFENLKVSLIPAYLSA